MQINQDAASQGHRGVRKYVGPVQVYNTLTRNYLFFWEPNIKKVSCQVAVQELDGWFSYNFALEQVRYIFCTKPVKKKP